MALAVGDANPGTEFVFPTSKEVGHPSCYRWCCAPPMTSVYRQSLASQLAAGDVDVDAAALSDADVDTASAKASGEGIGGLPGRTAKRQAGDRVIADQVDGGC